MINQYESKKTLIVVRTYPAPSRKYVELSCTAGITEDGEWLRLYPVVYRMLDLDKRFRKWQWVDLAVKKASRDPRPESYNIDHDSITLLTEPLPTDSRWRARRDILTPVQAPSMCWLRESNDRDGRPTLGFFKPKAISALVITKESPDWSPQQQGALQQAPMFGELPKEELQKIPYTFSYRFTCDDPTCRGHNMSCTDWEMGESYRKWSQAYGADWERVFRERYETDMILNKDTHFFVGTLSDHPKSWIIIGLFYPPKMIQGELL